MSHNEYRDQMTYDAIKAEEDTDASYMAMLDEFICDQKEKCSHDLSCIGCYPQEEEVDANGNSNSDYKKAEKECPIGYIVVWNRWEKGFKYRKLDKDGYMESL